MEGKPDFFWLKDWRVRALAVGCLIVGFLVAAPIFGKPSHLAPNWGDIPTWLAVGVATAGGWIALSQLRSQQSQLRDQQEDLRLDAEDRRRAQASRIFISVPSADHRGRHRIKAKYQELGILDIRCRASIIRQPSRQRTSR